MYLPINLIKKEEPSEYSSYVAATKIYVLFISLYCIPEKMSSCKQSLHLLKQVFTISIVRHIIHMHVFKRFVVFGE